MVTATPPTSALGSVDPPRRRAHSGRLDEAADLGRGAGGRGQRVWVAAQNGGAAAGPVRCARWAHAPGDGVGQGRHVERGAHVARQARHGGHGLGVDAFGQGGPDVAATGRPRLAHHGGQADVGQETSQHVGVTLGRARGAGGLGVQVEREQPEPLIGAGQVHRPRPIRRRAIDPALAGVLVEDLAVGVHGGHPHARPRTHSARQRPRRAGDDARMVWRRCRRYDDTTFRVSLRQVQRRSGLASRSSHRLIWSPSPNFDRSGTQLLSPAPPRAGAQCVIRSSVTPGPSLAWPPERGPGGRRARQEPRRRTR